MKLFVVETYVDPHWVPKTFWIGPLRFGLHTFPDCRVRRVLSRFEANELDTVMHSSISFLRFEWCLAGEKLMNS